MIPIGARLWRFAPSTIGWLGLGYVDGYDVDVKRSIFRKPKLQVFCIVIDGNLAAKIIPSALENTPFRYVMYL